MLILKIIGWILLFLLLLLIISLFTKVKIDLTYKFEPEDQRLTIMIKAFFGLIRHRIEIPNLKEKTNEEKKASQPNVSIDNHYTKDDAIDQEDALKSFRPVKQWMKNITQLYRMIKSFLKKVEISKLEWKSVIGTGDAATTGIIAGGGWAFKGTVIGTLSHYFSLRIMPKLEITPVFNRAISRTYIKCIFKFRIGHAILAGLKFLKYWKKTKSKAHTKDNAKSPNGQNEEQSV